MDEIALKQSILKKTVRDREKINSTPNSSKSVRFRGVEFMIINHKDDFDDEIEEDGDSIESDHPLDNQLTSSTENLFLSTAEKKHSNSHTSELSPTITLEPSKRVNLFNFILSSKPSARSMTTKTTCVSESPKKEPVPQNPPAFKPRTKATQEPIKTAPLISYINQRPQLLPMNRSANLNQRSVSYNRISGSSSSSNSSVSSHFQQNRINSATISVMRSLRTSASASAHKLNSALPNSAPASINHSLNLYSYLLQSNSHTRASKQINASLMRFQTKRLSHSNEGTLKPFVPRFNSSSTNYINPTMKFPNSASSYQSLASGTRQRQQGSLMSTPAKAQSAPSASMASNAKGGVIHVNARNLSFLTSTATNDSYINMGLTT